MKTFFKVSLIMAVVFFSCKKDNIAQKYKTENVIIIVIDGARFSETWGDSTHQYIPRLKQMAEYGVINTNFYNNGNTNTTAGHTAITTGYYEDIDNSGRKLPLNPSFFQYWNKKNNKKMGLSWIITSKDKLEILGNCQKPQWNDKYLPMVNCGVSGINSGYRHDSLTFIKAISIFSEHHPKLVLINFRDPDFSAHTNNWTSYLQGITNTDEYAYQIWNYIQQDSIYKNKTTLFITNDHGRHLNGIADGFAGHGDNCLGCRHVLLYAFGPDFTTTIIKDKKRELIDIFATTAELLQIKTKKNNGQIMKELFK